MRRLSVLVLVLSLLAFGAGCGGDDDKGGSTAAGGGGNFCTKAALIDKQFAELDKSFSGTDMPTDKVFAEAATAINELAKDAPSEIKADLELVAKGVAKIGEIFEGVDLSDPSTLSDPEVMAKLQEASTEMESLGTDIEDASDRITKYVKDECGIDLDESDGGSTDGS